MSRLILLLLFSASLWAQAPVVFFTDLLSGPKTGGENNNGTILTIYGKNFGASRGTSTVTIGGGAVAAYLQWDNPGYNTNLETISVAIGASASTGQVVVTTPSGASTCIDSRDSCNFTVRTGNIRCVSTTGNNANPGTFPSSCWATIPNAKNSMSGGDIAYVLNGVSATTLDDFSAAVAVTSNTGATASTPIALVAYPGASATIGSGSVSYGLRTPAVGGTKDYWVIAGFHIFGAPTGMDLLNVTGWRVIGNDYRCPNGNGQTACHHTDTTVQHEFYGNYVHDVGNTNGSIDKFYHAVYFTTNSNHIWAGWNHIAPNPSGSTTSGGCRAMQFFSTGGADQFDLHVHDNYIHDSICDGINFATVNPDNGTVEAYNNIVFHVGTGPDPANGASNYSCVLAGSSGTPTAAVLAYNNTFYDCGSRKTGDAGALAPDTKINSRNNILQQLAGESYINANAPIGSLSGSNNVYFGLGNGPTQTTSNVNSNPLLQSPTTNFHLQLGSPAIASGVTIGGLTYDFDGNVRPSGGSYDIGAYEFTGVTAQPPATAGTMFASKGKPWPINR